ncbi:hypothetical protein QBC37DRAFT_395103 [Rhypophila decipiens]|uniref:Uncharacterized protein n=1 Tax=Rhypophila decipiens TaxID=261697 RepID=A0AAN6YI62_9PEZI|nr:hypothetical protein QBC37DRAFT_395103 [Rhypophila decipiens]
MTASQQPSKPIDANWNLVQVLQLDNPETSGWTCKGRTQSGRRCRRLLTLANRNAIEAILPKILSTPSADETRELNLLTRCCLCYGHDDDSTAETVALQWAKDLESARSGNAAEQTDSLASGAVHQQQRSAGKKKPATEEQEQADTQNKDAVDEEVDTANSVPGPRRGSSSSPDLPSPPKLSLPVRTLRQTSQPSMSPPDQQHPAGPKISGEIGPHSHDCDDQDDDEEEEEAENEGIEEEDDDDDENPEGNEDEEYDMENEDEKAKSEKKHTKAEDEDGEEQDDEEDDDDDEQDVEVDDEEDEEEEAAEEEDGYESDEEDTGQEGEDDDRTATEKAEHGTRKNADIDAEEEGDDIEEEEEEDSDIGYEDYVEGEEEDEEDDEEDPEIDTRSRATTGILHTKKLQEAPLGEVLRRSGRQRSEPVDSLGGMSLR